MLHRYRHFKRHEEIRNDVFHHSRADKLEGQNIFEAIKRLAKPITKDELNEIAIENHAAESRSVGRRTRKRTKIMPGIINKDAKLLEHMDLWELLGRVKVFRQLFPQFKIHNKYLG